MILITLNSILLIAAYYKKTFKYSVLIFVILLFYYFFHGCLFAFPSPLNIAHVFYIAINCLFIKK